MRSTPFGREWDSNFVNAVTKNAIMHRRQIPWIVHLWLVKKIRKKMDQFDATVELIRIFFQNGVPGNSFRLISKVMAESVGPINYWKDSLDLITYEINVACTSVLF